MCNVLFKLTSGLLSLWFSSVTEGHLLSLIYSRVECHRIAAGSHKKTVALELWTDRLLLKHVTPFGHDLV